MLSEFGEILIAAAGFSIVVIASFQIAKVFQSLKLPLITGFLLTGLLAGPFIFYLLHTERLAKLGFINDFSLAFIAFAAGSELYLKELRGRYRSIMWNTMGQLVITFALSATAVYLLADHIGFMKEMPPLARMAVAMLAATIFVARSPASAIAIINEMRAKGPFVQTALGVTVVKDVLVVILFTIVFSASGSLINADQGISPWLVPDLAIELLLAGILGIVLARTLAAVLGQDMPRWIKTVLMLGMGYGVYVLSHFVQHQTALHLPFEMHLEPLLICIIAGFWVTNYTPYRKLFHAIIEEVGPFIYVIFFTYTGASMALDVLIKVWGIALILFAVRLVSMIIAGYVGGALGKDPKAFRSINWMPYVTQAGVGLGLAVIVENAYPDPGWGKDFSTIIIGVIVLNQIVGPPLFKWAIQRVGESHLGRPVPEFDGVRDALIFGLHNESTDLARRLKINGWQVKIITNMEDISMFHVGDLDIRQVSSFNQEILKAVDTEQAEAVIAYMDDQENLLVTELAFEFLGTKELITVINNPHNSEKFEELGATVVHPFTAITGLIDHLVRSPEATKLILGMEHDQDSLEIELQDPEMHGILLRDLKLPTDVVLLSLRRGDQVVSPHGFTRLRLHDQITVVGSVESIQLVELQLGPSKSLPPS